MSKRRILNKQLLYILDLLSLDVRQKREPLATLLVPVLIFSRSFAHNEHVITDSSSPSNMQAKHKEGR